MIWNQLDYATQLRIVNKIFQLALIEDDDCIKDGLIAAINELEIWSNSPIEDDELYVVQAQFLE